MKKSILLFISLFSLSATIAMSSSEYSKGYKEEGATYNAKHKKSLSFAQEKFNKDTRNAQAKNDPFQRMMEQSKKSAQTKEPKKLIVGSAAWASSKK